MPALDKKKRMERGSVDHETNRAAETPEGRRGGITSGNHEWESRAARADRSGWLSEFALHGEGGRAEMCPSQSARDTHGGCARKARRTPHPRLGKDPHPRESDRDPARHSGQSLGIALS